MKLRQQTVVVDAPRALCFEVVAAAGRRLEKRSESEWVVEFTTPVGGRQIRTIELLTLHRPSVIHYESLEGPLAEVGESIQFAEEDDGKTRLIYDGSFRVGKGPLGWVMGLLWVKRLFNRLVTEHLHQAKQVAERRAERTKIHAR